MDEINYKCPHCEESYIIKNFSSGMGNVIVRMCTECSDTLITDNPAQWDEYWKLFDDRKWVFDILYKCPCGGKFVTNVTLRCPMCNETLDRKGVLAQIGKDYPGDVSMGRILGPRVVWETICSFCGKRTDKKVVVDSDIPLYKCVDCESENV